MTYWNITKQLASSLGYLKDKKRWQKTAKTTQETHKVFYLED